MDNGTLQKFCDEVEHVLNGVRGDLLLYQQDSETMPRFAAHAERIACLLSSIELCEAAGVCHAMSQLYSQSSALGSITGRIPGDDVRSVLDRISDIESKIALVRMSDAAFSDELDRLLDASLEEIREEIGPSDSGLDISFASAEVEGFEIDDELLDIFAGEADELLTNIERHLQRLVNDPADTGSLWEIRRAAHTFKGSSGSVGLNDASRLAHRIEDLLDELSDDSGRSSAAIVSVLLSATECLRELTSGTRSAGLEQLLRQVHSEFDRIAGSTESSKPAVSAATSPDPEPAGKEQSKPAKAIVRVPLEQLDALVNLVRELVINRSVIGQRFIDLDRQVDELHNTTRRLRSVNSRLEVDLSSVVFDTDKGYRVGSAVKHDHAGWAKGHGMDQFHALEIDRYSELHESLRDLTETSSDTATIDHAVETLREQFGALLRQQSTIFDEIQRRIMSVRMVPFDTLKTRLERAVRVTCDDEKKKARLSIENGDTELDTQMIDEVIEPLLHLLKNAVVHGIELPETRRLLGKSETGTIVVRVDNQDTHVTLTVTDDGSGIAVSSLKERAIASGAIDRAAAATLSDPEAFGLIFKPGLTTARRVNLNAGRGVGMNIVKDNIESNNGTVTVASALQKGTSFTIRLPLKLAVTNALLVNSTGGIYAIPLKHIEKIVEIAAEEICNESGNVIWRSSEQEYAFRCLDESLGLSSLRHENSSMITALIVKSPASKLAIAVDGVIRTEEVVIKPLAKPFDGIRDVLGVAFLSSGELAPILDLPYLVSRSAKPLVEKPAVTPQVKRIFVMVVDDSPSVRHMTTKVIRNTGWDVTCAKDGLDAIEILKAGTRLPDLVLTDIEMPRMGGFELAAAMRDDPSLNRIPVVVVSSRSAEKHRQRAKEYGVDAYLVKPYEESQLVGLVRSLVAGVQRKEPNSDAAA